MALRRLEAPVERAGVVLLFVVYLCTDCDRREEKVTGVLSAGRHFIVTEHLVRKDSVKAEDHTTRGRGGRGSADHGKHRGRG